MLRIAGPIVIREGLVDGTPRSTALAIGGHSLRQLATFAGVDLATPFSAGEDTPELGDVDAPVVLDGGAAAALLSWLHVGSVALDRVMSHVIDPSLVQVWPEHFDVGLDVATALGRVNLGASPGDAAIPVPYLYVAPWERHRPGDPASWNAPFGAVELRSEGQAARDEVERAVAFFEARLRLLAGG